MIYKAVLELVQTELVKEKFKEHTYVNVEIGTDKPGNGDDYENCDFIGSVNRWKQEDDKAVSNKIPVPTTKFQDKNVPKLKQTEQEGVGPSPKLPPEISRVMCSGLPAQQSKITAASVSQDYVNLVVSPPGKKHIAAVSGTSADYVNVLSSSGKQELKLTSKGAHTPTPKQTSMAYEIPPQVHPQSAKTRPSGISGSDSVVPSQVHPHSAKSGPSGISGSDSVVPSQVHPHSAKSRPSGISGSDSVVPPQVHPQSAKTRPSDNVSGSDSVVPSQVHPQNAKSSPSGIHVSGSDYVIPPQVLPQSAKTRPSGNVSGSDYVIPPQVHPQSAKTRPSGNVSGSDYVIPPQVHPQSAKTRPSGNVSGSDYVIPPQVHPQSAKTRPSGISGSSYETPPWGHHQSSKTGRSGSLGSTPAKFVESKVPHVAEGRTAVAVFQCVCNYNHTVKCI